MTDLLFVTSNKVICDSFIREFNLSLKNTIYKGEVDLLFVENNKIDSTLHLTRILSTTKYYSKIVVINPVQSPSSIISYGTFVMAKEVIEWDKTILTTKLLHLTTKDLGNHVITGKGMSGDRECQGKTTPISQSVLVDTITYPLAKVSEYFNKQLLSIGIVVDHCTPNYSRLLQSTINELSSKMVSFVKENLAVLSD